SNLTFVAGQDGNGAWKVLTGGGGRYDLTVTGERYSFVYVCPSSLVQTLNFTVSEWANPVASCAGTPTTHDISGTVAGLTATQQGRVYIRSSFQLVKQPGSTYSTTVAEGSWDLVATAFETTAIAKLIVARNILVSGSVTRNFDFTTGG